LSHAGNQDVGEAVIVVIADRDAHAIHFEVEAGALGYVREGTIAIIAVEAQGRALAFVPRPIHGVYQQNVLPTIAVVIEERAAGAEGFRE
jgi:L-lactate utilization protein LutC